MLAHVYQLNSQRWQHFLSLSLYSFFLSPIFVRAGDTQFIDTTMLRQGLCILRRDLANCVAKDIILPQLHLVQKKDSIVTRGKKESGRCVPEENTSSSISTCPAWTCLLSLPSPILPPCSTLISLDSRGGEHIPASGMSPI